MCVRAGKLGELVPLLSWLGLGKDAGVGGLATPRRMGAIHGCHAAISGRCWTLLF